MMTVKVRWYVMGAVLFISIGAFIFGVVVVQTVERLIKDTEQPVRLCYVHDK